MEISQGETAKLDTTIKAKLSSATERKENITFAKVESIGKDITRKMEQGREARAKHQEATKDIVTNLERRLSSASDRREQMKDEQLKVLEAKSSKIERVVTSREQIKQDASQRLGAKIQKKIDSAILRKEQRLNEIIARTKTKHEQGANARLRREAAMEDLEQSMHSQLTSSQSDEQTIPIKQKPNHAANVQQ
eukprot:176700-Ditylum_brightwellii.AAC.1